MARKVLLIIFGVLSFVLWLGLKDAGADQTPDFWTLFAHIVSWLSLLIFITCGFVLAYNYAKRR